MMYMGGHLGKVAEDLRILFLIDLNIDRIAKTIIVNSKNFSLIYCIMV